jgi:hypothetical protein
MHMPVFRGTVFFNDPTYTLGWSENWFFNADSWVAGLVLLTGYYPLRAALMMKTSYVTALRVSNVDHQRDGLFSSVATAAGQGAIDPAVHPAAGLGDCVLFRKDDNTSYKYFNKLFLQSVPGEIFLGRQLADPIPAFWLTPLNAYQAYVLDPTKQFLVRAKLGTGGYLYQALSYFAPLFRTNRKPGRPFETLRGRRAIA